MDIYDIRRINFRLLLAQKKLSQKEMADRCGWQPPYVSQMLRGKNNIGAESARKIETATNMPPGWLDTLRDLLGDPQRGLRKAVEQDLLPISDAVANGQLDADDLRMLRILAEHLMREKADDAGGPATSGGGRQKVKHKTQDALIIEEPVDDHDGDDMDDMDLAKRASAISDAITQFLAEGGTTEQLKEVLTAWAVAVDLAEHIKCDE